ncbi:MAG: cobyric acid synthase, partial [Deltaproteobacteria bacterium]|nr:cobyric acid synthase [Deltaproteobacteria bacterium]
MIQGTASHVGKTVIVAGLCRMLSKRGIRVAPFKAQNMALNSFITKDGAEIGRAQAFQAEAAGIEPCAHMNPVLLKPTGDCSSQVIVRGRVYGQMSAREFHVFKKELKGIVYESYSMLAENYDFIVAEGAGSPAEVNLRDNDIVNMGFAQMADCPVVLVADIDRGGAFASLIGTMELLSDDERARVKGFIINKFRGDRTLLEPGLRFLTERTNVPVVGVIPYLGNLLLPEEDGVRLEYEGRDDSKEGADSVRIAVIRLPRISNFTDFDPLMQEQGVSVVYIDDAKGLVGADMVIIPGTKNTIADLLWLRTNGLEQAIKDHVSRGGALLGICGGFQMLGRHVRDPDRVEGSAVEAQGAGLLDVD